MYIVSTFLNPIRKPSLLRKICKCRNLHVMGIETDKFLPNYSELAPKYHSVVEYLNTPETSPTEVITDRIGDYLLDNLYNNTIGELLELCGDDLSKIHQLLGLYGLAEYAEVTPEAIIKNRNPKVREVRYNKNAAFSTSFYEYLLNNENGNLDDLYTRFGNMGRSMYKNCSMLGFVKTGHKLQLTNLGEERLPIYHDAMQSEITAADIETIFGDEF